MSRGPGKIERAVAAALEGNPSGTFTVEELGLLAYPGVNQIEKKHRVAVMRAVRNVAPPNWGLKSAGCVRGVQYILYNRTNLRSTGVANARKGIYPRDETRPISDGEGEYACLQRGDYRAYVSESGAYPVLVKLECLYQQNAAEEETEALRKKYNEIIELIIFKKKFRDDPPHPDFIRDCLSINRLEHST